MRGTDGSGSFQNGQHRRPSSTAVSRSSPRCHPAHKNTPVPKVTLRLSYKGHQQLFLRAVRKPAGGDSAPTAVTALPAVTPHPPPPAAPSREHRSLLDLAPREVRKCLGGPASPEGQGTPAVARRGRQLGPSCAGSRPRSSPSPAGRSQHRTPTMTNHLAAPEATGRRLGPRRQPAALGGGAVPPNGRSPLPSPLPLTALRSGEGSGEAPPAPGGAGGRRRRRSRRAGGAGGSRAAVLGGWRRVRPRPAQCQRAGDGRPPVGSRGCQDGGGLGSGKMAVPGEAGGGRRARGAVCGYSRSLSPAPVR